MSLRLGDIAPNFKAKTTAGDLDFYEYLGNGWGILFSHSRRLYTAYVQPNWEKLPCCRRNLRNAM